MIHPQTRLGENALWMMLSRFGAQGLAVVFTILLARRLGSGGFGEYALIATVIFVANAVTTFGTDMMLIREIAARGDLSRLSSALLTQLVLSGLFIAAVWMFGARIPNQSAETITALKIYSLALIPLAFFTVFTSVLRGLQRMDHYALLNIIVSALQVVAVLILREKNLALLASFLLFVQILMALCAGLLCSFIIPQFWQAFHLSLLFLSSFLKEAAPIACLALLGMLYQRLNIYLLSTMSGATETGLYSAAFRAVEASKTAHLAVFAALYPAMANGISLGTSDGRAANKIENMRYLRILVSGAIVITLLLFLLARPLVILLYGNEFIASASVLQILAWMLIPFTVNTYLTLSFLASNREKLVGRALTVSLLGLLILNLWWIPIKGPVGSAWAALVAECMQSVILVASARSFVRVQGDTREFSELS